MSGERVGGHWVADQALRDASAAELDVACSDKADTAANQTYDNIHTLVAAEDSKQEHDMIKSFDVVGSEAIATKHVLSTADDKARVGHVVGTAESKANVGHDVGTADSKTKPSIMISGTGGLRWRSTIGTNASERQRDFSSWTKRQRDASIGREKGRGEKHDRSRSSHMEGQLSRRDHDNVTSNVPWIIGTERHHDSNLQTTIHDPSTPDNPVSAFLTFSRYPLSIHVDAPSTT